MNAATRILAGLAIVSVLTAALSYMHSGKAMKKKAAVKKKKDAVKKLRPGFTQTMYSCTKGKAYFGYPGREAEAMKRLKANYLELVAVQGIEDEKIVIAQYNDYTLYVVRTFKQANPPTPGFCIEAAYPMSASKKKHGSVIQSQNGLGGCCKMTPLGLHRVAEIQKTDHAIRLVGADDKVQYKGYDRRLRACFKGTYMRGIAIKKLRANGVVGKKHISNGSIFLEEKDHADFSLHLFTGKRCGDKRVRYQRQCGFRTIPKFCKGTPVYISVGGPPMAEN